MSVTKRTMEEEVGRRDGEVANNTHMMNGVVSDGQKVTSWALDKLDTGIRKATSEIASHVLI